MPSATLSPRIARSSSRSASWKGCVVAPDARDIRILSIQPGKGHDQGAQSSQWGNSPKRGVEPPQKGFPPHPSGGVSETQLDNRHPVSASPAIAGMGDGKSGFIVPRGLTVSASGWNCPCRRGFGAFLPPGFEPWCDEEGPPPWLGPRFSQGEWPSGGSDPRPLGGSLGFPGNCGCARRCE